MLRENTSPLTQGRGLKRESLATKSQTRVAPYTGAWIETRMCGCWTPSEEGVAPYTGAWIETITLFKRYLIFASPLTQGRGLKL